MPTVIVLDTSLSMCRPVPMAEVTESFQYRNLAVHGLTHLLDYMNINCKLEFAALMSFNSHRDALVPFTRDFDSIKVAIMNIEYYDRSRIKNGLEGVQSLIMEEWGAGVPCQDIVQKWRGAPFGESREKVVLNIPKSIKHENVTIRKEGL